MLNVPSPENSCSACYFALPNLIPIVRNIGSAVRVAADHRNKLAYRWFHFDLFAAFSTDNEKLFHGPGLLPMSMKK